jgi:large subunit ribosomal protein L28
VGHSVSHAHNLTKRRWLPNLVAMRALIGGRAQRVRVCTRCLKAGKVTKVI